MKTIFAKQDYQIKVDVDQHRAWIVKGIKVHCVTLERLTPLSPVAARNLKLLGSDPKAYLNIGQTSQVVLKEAAEAWEQAVREAELAARRKDTSMIPAFWESLPGLAELRDAEDTYAECQKSATLMLEYEQRGVPPAQLMELRRRFPRAAAYIRAETSAFSGDDGVAEGGRRAMHILVTGGDVDVALSLLPDAISSTSRPERQRGMAGAPGLRSH